ncbi:mannose/cellobiose epimerase-like protein (N-acyl-D-glucosamine 2-epimerase family) [Microvirga flocculans]|uniref:Mannose/cellobiose epimerase-like protein (N-acyl-D-glucosamine 2-epimerase family) n=1 Tax=Microvirga flocculans TaxID=217168 RepID=A0A7W6N9H4_9HYPH|nr:AGE family epimerase/isomerase [Microvirga flocculans]MBB4041716.1 mannose/cellobiose epimerase-like protein (N-acyl-D-glucosamine 2-epimerase family) [Microvirga flocculans]
MTQAQPILPPLGMSWRSNRFHRQWLFEQASRLFDFFQYAAINPAGGFFDLDDEGRPLDVVNPVRQIHCTTRMVHCFAIGILLGRPGCDAVVDHGMSYLWNAHRDALNGGYVWSLDDDGPKDDTKQAYGHAFVLLAASSAKVVGHPLADRMLQDVTQVLEERFWEERHGAVTEEFSRDWQPLSQYRGQNSNMHLTEALMAAFEATGERAYLDKAERIAGLIIGRHAASLGYRVAEHFDADWSLDRDYRGHDMFRPFGTTPGHWLEWARLLLQLWVLGGRRHAWIPEAARALFRQAVALGWDRDKGGFFYALDWNDEPRLPQKLWWPCAEAIGAAAFLSEHCPSDMHEQWYRTFWGFADRYLIDRHNGGWRPELTADLKPGATLFSGKPDLYHALQACLIPLFPATGSLTRVIPESLAQD